jgi:tripartite-type tricarboxylate transporter receptor subunit TctC
MTQVTGIEDFRRELGSGDKMVELLANLFKLRTIAAITLAGTIMTHSAAAQDPAATYPNRTIRLIVPYAAGGGIDVLARLVSQKMSEGFGQPVIVENKPGASGELSAEYVKKAIPDGYTLLVTSNGPMAVSPATKAKLSYSPLKDFAPIGLIASFPLVLVVNNDLPIHSMNEFVAYAKANPDKANYAEPAVAFQLVIEILKQKTGAPLQMIPYKSSSQAVLSVIGGNTIAALVDSGPAAGSIKANKVRALAISSAERSPEFPDVPTMKEAGFPELSISFWSGMFAPADVPPAIVKKLETELLRIVKLPDIQARLKALAEVPEGRNGEETRRFVEGQITMFSAIARSAKLVRD